MWKLITEAWRYRYVTENFVVTSLGNRYKRSVFGYLWSVLFPFLRYLVMALMFSFVLQNKDPLFYPNFFVGMTIFSFITIVIGSSTKVYLSNMGIIKKMYVPKLTFILNTAFLELANYFLVLLALLLLAVATGYLPLNLGLLISLPGLFLSLIFVVGVSTLVAVGTVWFNDIQYFVDLVMQTLLFVTPIMFPASFLPDYLYLFNPFYYFVEVVRIPLVTGAFATGEYYIVAFALAGLAFLGGLAVLHKNENGIVYRL